MPAQLDFGSPLALASQPNTFGIDSNRVFGTVDGDLPLEFFVEDGSHVGVLHCVKKMRPSDSALGRLATTALRRATAIVVRS